MDAGAQAAIRHRVTAKDTGPQSPCVREPEDHTGRDGRRGGEGWREGQGGPDAGVENAALDMAG